MQDRTCLDCGADISARHGNAKRCEPCSRVVADQCTAHTRPRSKDCADAGDGKCVPGRLRRGRCDRHYRKAKPSVQPLVDHECAVCATVFVTRTRTTCSRPCYLYSRRHPGHVDPADQRVCLTCGDPLSFELRRSTGYCSKRCRSAASKRRNRPILAPYVRNTECAQCEGPIVGRKAGVKYCSEACEIAVNGLLRRIRERSLPSEPISPLAIARRDNWRCHLCDTTVDPDAARDRDRPTLDHIIPLADPFCPGHVWENVSLAHKGCNSAKSHRTRPQDWALYQRLHAEIGGDAKWSQDAKPRRRTRGQQNVSCTTGSGPEAPVQLAFSGDGPEILSAALKNCPST